MPYNEEIPKMKKDFVRIDRDDITDLAAYRAVAAK
jgi:hypothetical protein